MTVHPSTLPLDWPALCGHVRRGWLAVHRGELPPCRPGTAPLDAPVGIAACAQFGQRHAFATEAEAETWRWVGRRALNTYNRWTALRYDREDVRVALGAVRYWRDRGDARQAGHARVELRRRWTVYRLGMRALASQLNAVRRALSLCRVVPDTAAAATPAPIPQAAE